jgi:hypothetical protein
MRVAELPVAGCNVYARGEEKIMKRLITKMFVAGALALAVAAVVPTAPARAPERENRRHKPSGTHHSRGQRRWE